MAIGVDIWLRSEFLVVRICRYFNLQVPSPHAFTANDTVSEEKGEDGKRVSEGDVGEMSEETEDHIVNICEKTQESIHALIWSGLPITSSKKAEQRYPELDFVTLLSYVSHLPSPLPINPRLKSSRICPLPVRYDLGHRWVRKQASGSLGS